MAPGVTLRDRRVCNDLMAPTAAGELDHAGHRHLITLLGSRTQRFSHDMSERPRMDNDAFLGC